MGLRGELGRVSAFSYYTEPVIVELRYEKISKDPFPEPQEAQVFFQLTGKGRSAFVPLFLVDEDRGTVKAALVGEDGEKILVSFPPTNFGQTRFMADEESLNKIAALSSELA